MMDTSVRCKRRPILILAAIVTAGRADSAFAQAVNHSLSSQPMQVGYGRGALIVVAAAVIAVQAVVVAAFVLRARLRRMERALRTGEARRGAMLLALSDMLFVFNRKGIYVDYHAADPAALYVPPETFLGRHVREVMPPALAARFADAFAQALASPQPVVIEYALDSASGRSEHEARIVRCGEDEILSLVRDVTAGKASTRALIEGEVELRASQSRNRTLAGRLIMAQEAERQRIARDLHDDLSQKLAVLNIEMHRLATTSLPETRRRLDEMSDNLGSIAHDVQQLSHELHPSRPQMLGLEAAVRGVCADISRRNAVAVEFEAHDIPRRLDPAVSLCAYRIVQESLHNVVRHSGARQARVKLTALATGLTLGVSDDGCGFKPDGSGFSGLGLVSMRERVRLLRGHIAIHSSPGTGTRVDVLLPLTPAVEAPGAVNERSA